MPVIRPPTDPISGQPLPPDSLRDAAMDLMGPGTAVGQVVPQTGRIARLLYDLVSQNPQAKKLIKWLHQRPEQYHIQERDPLGGALGQYSPRFQMEKTPEGQLEPIALGGGTVNIHPRLTDYQAPRALIHELGHAYDFTKHGLYPADPALLGAVPGSDRNYSLLPQPLRAADWLRRTNPKMAAHLILDHLDSAYPLSPEAMARVSTDAVFGGRTAHGSLWPNDFGQPPMFSDMPSEWRYLPPGHRLRP